MRPRVVICGSYRKDAEGLLRLFQELEATGCRILSPLSLDFANPGEAFVTTTNDQYFSISELERFHLRALREADVIWLHNPDGYVGLSAAYELGYAAALQKKIFAFEPPQDQMLATQTTVVSSVFEALRVCALLHRL